MRRKSFVKITSGLEDRFVKEFLEPLKIKFVRQYRVGIFVFDFFLPDYNVLVEIHGGYWHGDKRLYPDGNLNPVQKKNQIRDVNKSKSALSLGFSLLTFWEGDIIFRPDEVQAQLEEALP